MKKCPFCAELIQDEAIVCRYCDRDLLRKEVESSYTVLEKIKEKQSRYRFEREDFNSLLAAYAKCYEDYLQNNKTEILSILSTLIEKYVHPLLIEMTVDSQGINKVITLIFIEGLQMAYLCFYIGTEGAKQNIRLVLIPYYLNFFSAFYPQYIIQFISNISSASRNKKFSDQKYLKVLSSEIKEETEKVAIAIARLGYKNYWVLKEKENICSPNPFTKAIIDMGELMYSSLEKIEFDNDTIRLLLENK